MNNPFEILNVAVGAGKGEILAAAALVMRARTVPLPQIAAAQRALLDPMSHAAHAFVHFLDASTPAGSGLARQEPDPSRRQQPRAPGDDLLVRSTFFDDSL